MCEKPRGRPLHRKKTKACALALKERAKHTNSRIAIMDACCTNTISARGGTMSPSLPPLGHVTLFKRTRNITNTPNGATPTGCTLLGSCPPPVTTGVNLHVYPLIRAGICFSFFFFFLPFHLASSFLYSQGSLSFLFLSLSLLLFRSFFYSSVGSMLSSNLVLVSAIISCRGL